MNFHKLRLITFSTSFFSAIKVLSQNRSKEKKGPKIKSEEKVIENNTTVKLEQKPAKTDSSGTKNVRITCNRVETKRMIPCGHTISQKYDPSCTLSKLSMNHACRKTFSLNDIKRRLTHKKRVCSRYLVQTLQTVKSNSKKSNEILKDRDRCRNSKENKLLCYSLNVIDQRKSLMPSSKRNRCSIKLHNKPTPSPNNVRFFYRCFRCFGLSTSYPIQQESSFSKLRCPLRRKSSEHQKRAKFSSSHAFHYNLVNFPSSSSSKTKRSAQVLRLYQRQSELQDEDDQPCSSNKPPKFSNLCMPLEVKRKSSILSKAQRDENKTSKPVCKCPVPKPISKIMGNHDHKCQCQFLIKKPPPLLYLVSKTLNKLQNTSPFYTQSRLRGKRALKYFLLCIVILVWSPCVLVLWLCWYFSYPFRPQHLICTKNGNRCQYVQEEKTNNNKFHVLMRLFCSCCWKKPFVLFAIKCNKQEKCSLEFKDQLPKSNHNVLSPKSSRIPKKCPDSEKDYNLHCSDGRGWLNKNALTKSRIPHDVQCRCIPNEENPSSKIKSNPAATTVGCHNYSRQISDLSSPKHIVSETTRRSEMTKLCVDVKCECKTSKKNNFGKHTSRSGASNVCECFTNNNCNTQLIPYAHPDLAQCAKCLSESFKKSSQAVSHHKPTSISNLSKVKKKHGSKPDCKKCLPQIFNQSISTQAVNLHKYAKCLIQDTNKRFNSVPKCEKCLVQGDDGYDSIPKCIKCLPQDLVKCIHCKPPCQTTSVTSLIKMKKMFSKSSHEKPRSAHDCSCQSSPISDIRPNVLERSRRTKSKLENKRSFSAANLSNNSNPELKIKRVRSHSEPNNYIHTTLHDGRVRGLRNPVQRATNRVINSFEYGDYMKTHKPECCSKSGRRKVIYKDFKEAGDHNTNLVLRKKRKDLYEYKVHQTGGRSIRSGRSHRIQYRCHKAPKFHFHNLLTHSIPLKPYLITRAYQFERQKSKAVVDSCACRKQKNTEEQTVRHVKHKRKRRSCPLTRTISTEAMRPRQRRPTKWWLSIKRIWRSLMTGTRSVSDTLSSVDREVWKDVRCDQLYIQTLRHKPCFWLHQCAPGCYPYFLECRKTCCEQCMLCITMCLWSPMMCCIYACYMLCCRICSTI